LFVFLLKDFEKDRVDSVLNTIFNTNVMTFGGGKIGAVNGMTRSGQLEIVSMQSEEIWTGVTYGLSSTMIMEVRFSSMYRMSALIFAL
jgi:non-lysosomal glucosylceramidase